MLSESKRLQFSFKSFLEQNSEVFWEYTIGQAQKERIWIDKKPDVLVTPLLSDATYNKWLQSLQSSFPFHLVYYTDNQNLATFDESWVAKPDAILIDPISELQTIATLKVIHLNLKKPKYQATGVNEKVQTLTLREQEIVRLVRQGLSSREIADLLFLSMNTINTHKRRIKEKLGLRKFVELA